MKRRRKYDNGDDVKNQSIDFSNYPFIPNFVRDRLNAPVYDREGKYHGTSGSSWRVDDSESLDAINKYYQGFDMYTRIYDEEGNIRPKYATQLGENRYLGLPGALIADDSFPDDGTREEKEEWRKIKRKKDEKAWETFTSAVRPLQKSDLNPSIDLFQRAQQGDLYRQKLINQGYPIENIDDIIAGRSGALDNFKFNYQADLGVPFKNSLRDLYIRGVSDETDDIINIDELDTRFYQDPDSPYRLLDKMNIITGMLQETNPDATMDDAASFAYDPFRNNYRIEDFFKHHNIPMDVYSPLSVREQDLLKHASVGAQLYRRGAYKDAYDFLYGNKMGSMAYTQPGKLQMKIDPRQAQGVNVDLGFEGTTDQLKQSLLGIGDHELAHLMGANNPQVMDQVPYTMNEADRDLLLSKIKPSLDKTKLSEHDLLGSERKADLDALRADMFRTIGYDFGKEQLTPKILEKYKKHLEKNPKPNLPVKRTFDFYDDDAIIEINNRIAFDTESEDSDIQFAQDGDEVKYDLSKTKPKESNLTPEEQFRLDDYFGMLNNDAVQRYFDKSIATSEILPDGTINPDMPAGAELSMSPIDFAVGAAFAPAVALRSPMFIADLLLNPFIGFKNVGKNVGKESITLPAIRYDNPVILEDALQTQRVIENAVQNRRNYITSDEYLKKRMANTGESAEEVKAAVNKYLQELDNSTITYKPLDNAAGQYSGRGQIDIDSRKNAPFYLRNTGKENRILEHEIDHLLSPAGKPNPKAPTKFEADGKTLTKEYKDFLLAGNTATEGGVKGFENPVGTGVYKNYPTLELSSELKANRLSKDRKDPRTLYTYLKDPSEQQVRHLGAGEHLKKFYKWDGTEAGLTDDMLNNFIDDLQGWNFGNSDLHDVGQIYRNLDGIGDNIFALDGEVRDLARQAFRERVRKVLPKAWAVSGFAIGANQVAEDDNTYEDGAKVRKRLPSASEMDYDRLYEALMMTEHHNYLGNKFDDTLYSPWIRTMTAPKAGSTAYGPVQLGSGLIKTYLQKYQADKAGMTPDDINTLQLLRQQGLEFSKHGRNKGKIADYNPIFDYGGSGTFANTAENRLAYKNVVMKMFNDQLNRVSSGDIYHMLENWRGPTKPELLQDYISKVEDYYYNPIEYTTPYTK